jgi:DnaK suppressor protein
MEESQVETIKDSLNEERRHVEQQLAEHGAAIDREGVEVQVDGGFADSAQATAERSELLSLVEGLQAQHREVLAALQRLEQGTYGKCERCGQDIVFERLEARPMARLCVSCQQAVT